MAIITIGRTLLFSSEDFCESIVKGLDLPLLPLRILPFLLMLLLLLLLLPQLLSYYDDDHHHNDDDFD